MSAGVEVWKRAFATSSQRSQEFASGLDSSLSDRDSEPESSIVQQIFFGPSHVRRVMFAAVGKNFRISSLCVRIGQHLVRAAKSSVALIDCAQPWGEGSNSCDGEPLSDSSGDGEHCLCRLPSSLLMATGGQSGKDERRLVPFPYMLLLCDINHSMLPIFCRACDGAVLVLTANQTRREAAARAQRLLQQHGVGILGSMLYDREFPIPESIYNRL